MHRGLTAEIDLDAALYNLTSLKAAAGGLPVIAVVKADAYGHGAVELSRLYQKAGVHALAVAFLSEARQLREAGVTAPVLVLFDRSEVKDYFALGLTPVIHDADTARAFSEEASRGGTVLDVHVKVDTGMGRMGMPPLPEEVLSVARLPGLRVAGLMTHFSEADLADGEFMAVQLRRFHSLREALAGAGLTPLCHVANSAACLAFRESHLDALRPGLALYGESPFEDGREGLAPLKPVMTVKARVLALRRMGAGQPVSYGRTFVTKRDTLAAVLAVGYAEGFSRRFSNTGHALLGGTRAPVMGRVCMDLVVVDATEAQGVREFDEAVLLGAQGDERITAWELARTASTIPYEILCSLGRGARRAYTG
ncbi:MAG: alanine racemase [Nitrospirota bacterium]